MTTEFGPVVRAALASRGLSLRKAAPLISYNYSHLSNVLSGRRRPTPEMARAIDDLVGAQGAIAALIRDPDQESRVERFVAQPSRVDEGTVSALARSLAAQRDLDDHMPAAPLIGPTLGQLEYLRPMLREARGKHRDTLAEVVSETIQFAGWLCAETRVDEPAMRLLDEAASLAEELPNGGVLAAQARGFRGWLARQQGEPGASIEWFLKGHHTRGAHPAQRVQHAVQAAHGFAVLGSRDAAKRLLDRAESLSDAARDTPPGTAYWLTPDYQRLNVGLVYAEMGELDTAAQFVESAFSSLPESYRDAEWAGEYRAVLAAAAA